MPLKRARYEAFHSVGMLYEAMINDFNERHSEEDVEDGRYDESEFTKWWEKALAAHGLPNSVHTADEVHHDANFEYVESCLEGFFGGTLNPEEVGEFYAWLEEIIDFDWTYVLFGIPNYDVDLSTRNFLVRSLFNIGCRYGGLPDNSWVEGWLLPEGES